MICYCISILYLYIYKNFKVFSLLLNRVTRKEKPLAFLGSSSKFTRCVHLFLVLYKQGRDTARNTSDWVRVLFFLAVIIYKWKEICQVDLMALSLNESNHCAFLHCFTAVIFSSCSWSHDFYRFRVSQVLFILSCCHICFSFKTQQRSDAPFYQLKNYCCPMNPRNGGARWLVWHVQNDTFIRSFRAWMCRTSWKCGVSQEEDQILLHEPLWEVSRSRSETMETLATAHQNCHHHRPGNVVFWCNRSMY